MDRVRLINCRDYLPSRRNSGRAVMIRIIALTVLLVGCAGTQMAFEGNVCGQPVSLSMVDKKDRSGFTATVTCPNGGTVTLATSDSSTSAYVKTLVDGLVGMADKLAKTALVAPATFESVASPAPGELLWAVMQTTNGRRQLGLEP